MGWFAILYTRTVRSSKNRFLDVTIKINFNSYMKEGHDPRKPNRAGSLHLLGGNLALNFANTESGRNGSQHLNHIQSAADVTIWAKHAGVIDEKRILPETDAGQHELFRQGTELRETIYQINSIQATGGTPSAELVQSLASAHSKTLQSARLTFTDGKYSWQWKAESTISDEILGPIAEAAISLLMQGDPKRIKQCQGQHCGWLFYDASKNNSRHWCDMSVCGNRSKIKAYRQRRQNPATAP